MRRQERPKCNHRKPAAPQCANRSIPEANSQTPDLHDLCAGVLVAHPRRWTCSSGVCAPQLRLVTKGMYAKNHNFPVDSMSGNCQALTLVVDGCGKSYGCNKTVASRCHQKRTDAILHRENQKHNKCLAPRNRCTARDSESSKPSLSVRTARRRRAPNLCRLRPHPRPNLSKTARNAVR